MRFKTTSGLSIAYRTAGVGRTIVLLHPIGLCGAFWDPVVKELEAEFRLIVPDARGHGDSEVPNGPFGLDELADDVVSLVRAVGQPPTIVVGCSMGGMTAQAVAVRAPEIVAGLVIANTGHRRNDRGRATMEQRAFELKQGMPAVVRGTLARWFDDEFKLSRPDSVLKARDWLLSADPVVQAWSWLAIRDLNYTDRLELLPKPALAVAGLRDESASPAVMKEMAAALRSCAYHDIDAGHLTPFERPKEFASVVREFARSIVCP
jgi:3-oxoadipate enol-lactonase